MADGDQFPGLKQPFVNAYMEICENHHDPEGIADRLLGVMQKDIGKRGDMPIYFLERVASLLDELPTGPLLNPAIDWGKVSDQIADIARSIEGQPRTIDLVVEVCDAHIVAFNYGESTAEHYPSLVQAYLDRLWKANFAECVPFGEHYSGIAQETFDQRLEEVRPYVENGLGRFAEQIILQGTVARLRRLGRPKSTLTADTDLLAKH